MVDEEEFRRWRDEADRAFEGAHAQAERQLYNWACFSCEQAAQLAVKALLHGIGKGPWGHDLDGLVRSLGEADLAISPEIEAAATRLGRHYIPARYPDAHAAGSPGRHYRQSDWEQARTDALALLKVVDGLWESTN